jgi:glycosyltransferase involved in cell wall biosynthesis
VASSDFLRLVKFVTLFEPGGTERQFVNLALALDRRRFDLRFSCLNRTGPYVKTLEDHGLSISEYPIRGFVSPGYVAQATRLTRDLSRDHVQIVHTYSFYGNVFAVPAARAAGVPVVIASIRDRGAYLTPRQQRVQRYVCRLADCVLVNADSVKDWLVEDGYDAAKITVIKNGIDLSGFNDHLRRNGERTDNGLRAELGLPAGVPLIAVSGRVNPSKGLEHFLHAAASVHATYGHARFLVVGPAPDAVYLERLHEMTRQLGIADRVIFMGHRSDLPRILGDVTVAVLASLNEAMPNAVLEAMAAGLPVVATRVGGVPEAIEDGVTGLLVPPADAPALASAIRRLLAAPEHAIRIGQAAAHSVRACFSMERMVQATQDLYRELASRKGLAERPHLPLTTRVPARVIAERRP